MCFDSKSLVDSFGQFFQSAHFSLFRTDWPRALAGESLKGRNWMAQFVSLSLSCAIFQDPLPGIDL